MSRHLPLPGRWAVALCCALLLVGALLLAPPLTGPAGANRATESSGRPDHRLGRPRLRADGPGAPRLRCSRTACRIRGEQVRRSPNAETCLVGGRAGAAYGTEVDARTCARLHRRFVAAVNFCASNPHRALTLIHPRAAVRRAVHHLRRHQPHHAAAARRAARPRAATTCACARSACPPPRAGGRAHRAAACAAWSSTSPAPPHPVPPARHRPGRRRLPHLARHRRAGPAAARLGHRRRLGPQLRRARAAAARFDDRHRGVPTGLVVALGTNPARGFDLDDLRAVVDRLSDHVPVVLVTPFRRLGPATPASRSAPSTAPRPTCAPRPPTGPSPAWPTGRRWPSDGPDLLVDGTHQTRAAEQRWARFVSSTWTEPRVALTPPAWMTDPQGAWGTTSCPLAPLSDTSTNTWTAPRRDPDHPGSSPATPRAVVRGRRWSPLLVAVLGTVLLSAGATVAQDARGRQGADGARVVSAAAAVQGSPARAVAPTVVRSIVTAAAPAGRASLGEAQLHEQRCGPAAVDAADHAAPPSPARRSPPRSTPASTSASCSLLGRTWSDAGCSRQSCVTGHEYAKTGANAETCRIGGRRGASYGVEVDFRRCEALHRAWIGVLNYCASDPHRTETVIAPAPAVPARPTPPTW